MKTIKKAKKKDNKKKGLLFLFLAGIIIVGYSVAYFSDVITGTGSMTTGTFDITAANLSVKQNGGANLLDSNNVAEIVNLTPGDVVVVDATATNLGNKSAWVRGYIKFDLSETDSIEDLDKIKVYEGTFTLAEILNGDADSKLLTLNAQNEISGGVKVLNGIGDGAEIESHADVVASYPATYTIYLDKTAGNEYQGQKLGFDFKIQAVQFRNNSGQSFDDVTSVSVGN